MLLERLRKYLNRFAHDKNAFPEGFLWGASMSAYQTEGGDTNNDWYRFEVARNIVTAKRAGIATDHYHRFREDFDLAKDLNLNTIRLSIEWSRIEPTKGVFDNAAVDHYREVLAYLKEKGFTVILALHHFTNPLWFADLGGWANPESTELFTDYVKFITPMIAEYVDYWITFNEPGIINVQGYIVGNWPPGEVSLVNFYRANGNMADAHKRSYHYLKERYPEAPVGIICNFGFSPANLLGRIMKMPIDFMRNYLFLDWLGRKYDFIGVNYYFPGYVPRFFGNDAIDRTDLDWPIYPRGLYNVLTRVYRRYHVPLIITENGLADQADTKRARFIHDHLAMVKKAQAVGVNVFGYLHWALTDNLELVEGFEPRFGLIAIDYPTLTRTVRRSAKYYAKICKSNRLVEPE